MSDATDILSAVQALEGHGEPGVATQQESEDVTPVNIKPADTNVIHTDSGPMTLLSVQLDAHDDPQQAIIAQALKQQPQGTQLIVHIQDGSTKDMQVLLDGNLVPVSSVSDVIASGTTTTTALPPPASLPPVRVPPSRLQSVKPVIQRASSNTDNQRNQTKKRKRHQSVVIDEQTQLSGESFKSQLLNTSDTIRGLDLAPPTKLVMDYTSTIDLDTLFGFPGRPHSSKEILNAFSRNLGVVSPRDKSMKRPKLPEVPDAELTIDITSMIANHDFGFKIM